jgi:hypothetical protein
MDEVQIKHRPEATTVALIAWRGDYWLWFTMEQGRLVPTLVSSDQIRNALRDGFGDAEAKTYLETRIQAAGYQLRPTAIQSADIAVWDITNSSRVHTH